MPKINKTSFSRVAYVFQGGGALGAYQLGVYKALSETGFEPDWVIGTSIGAINACIIAGNKPKDRIPKLEAFWHTISRSLLPGFKPRDNFSRQWYNLLSAQSALLFGQPGFFYPRVHSPFLEFNGSSDTISFYVTDPLKETLKKLVDFDYLNSGNVRFTLGAVEVQKGIAVFFDTKNQTIGPEHVLASCALPPGFPAVRIDDKYYWDGGVLSNTPIQAMIYDQVHENTLCFMANLFDSYGLNPKSLDDILKRRKDVTYSSQDRMHLKSLLEILRLRREIQFLYGKLSDEAKECPEVRKLHDIGNTTMMHFVRFLYTAPHSELSSKDYEFSELSINERIETGYQDGLEAIKESPWEEPIDEEIGVAIHEICRHPIVTTPWQE